MRTIPFDTHAYVKRLVAAGVPEPQAEVHAQAFGEVGIEDLATKQDLELLRQEIEQEFQQLRQEIDVKLSQFELRLTVRFGGMLVAAVAILAAIMKLF